MYLLNVPKLIIYLCVLMLIATLANIILACATNFSCGQFLPTLNYLGCFRGHDRVYIVTCTYFACVLAIFFIGAYLRFKTLASKEMNIIITGLSCLITLILPLVALTDEVNGVHYLPLETIQVFLANLFTILSIMWTVLSYRVISRHSNALNSDETAWLLRLRVMIIYMSVMIVVLLIERQFCYSEYANAFLNEQAESVVEWILVCNGILMPIFFAQFFRRFNISFSI